jgi:hypothetical protein
MAYLPAVQDNDVLRVDVIGDFNTANALVNAYQFRVTEGGGVAVADALTDLVALVTALLGILKALSTAETVWRRIRVSNITQDVVYGETNLASAIGGTASGDPNAPGVCALMYARTLEPRIQLRKFWGPLAEVHLNNEGIVYSSTQTVLANACALLAADYVGTYATYRYGLFSPKLNQWIEPVVVAYTTIPAYQRRRRQGRGI